MTTTKWMLSIALALAGCAANHTVQCTSAADCARGDRCEMSRCVSITADGGPIVPVPDDARPPSAWDAGPIPGVDAAMADGAYACGAATFEVTETQEAVVVPEGVRYMHVEAWGAGGNGEAGCGTTEDGGPGGYTEGVFEVAPGTVLTLIVGKRGRAGTTGEDVFRFGFGAWGGGGLTGVFRGGDPVSEEDRDRALLIAGGGGSASVPGCHPGGPGNHPDAGGEGTMQGAFGEGESVIGGGGGYEGGSGGANSVPAAGGVGYVAPEALDARILWSEPSANAAPPATDDPDYVAPVGRTEQSGRLVIHYLCEAPPPLI